MQKWVNKGENMLGHEDRKEITKSNHNKTRSTFAVTAIWIAAIGTLAGVLVVALLLMFSSPRHNRHNAFGGGNEHRSSASQGNMDDGMQPAPYQSPGSLANG